MRVQILLLLVLLTPGVPHAAVLDAETRAYVAERPLAEIGVIADNEPYSMMRGGGAEGFSIDVLEEIAQHTGLRFQYEAGSWPEIYLAFEQGDLDAIDGLSWHAERERFTLFTEPYHHRRAVIMHNAERPIGDIRALEELKPHRVGIIRGIHYKSAFTRRGIAVTEYEGPSNLVRALAFGWVDAIAGPEVTLGHLARDAGLHHLAVAGRVDMDGLELVDLRIGVRKELPQLHRAIAAGLAAIPRERMAELLAAWRDFGGKPARLDQGFRLDTREAKYVRRLGGVSVGFAQDYAPFSFGDGGKAQGLSVDVLARLQDLTGLDVVPVTNRWPVLLEMLQRGEIDLLANVSRTPERGQFARFTEPYHVIPNVAFTRDPDMRLRHPDDLSGLRVGFISGVYYEAELRRRIGQGAMAFSAQEALFEALADGRVDLVLMSLHIGNHWVRELKLNDVRIAGELDLPGFSGEDLRFGARPALEPLVAILDRALVAISPTERRSIEDRWLGASVSASQSVRTEFSESEKAWLARKGRLIACVDPEWMPLEGVDGHGQHRGISADYLARMSRDLSIPIEVLRTRSWQESVEAAQARRCDLYPMAMETPQRRVYMNFTTPYYTTPSVLLARIESPFVDGLDELGDGRVGIVRGYAFAELLRIRHPRLNLVEVDSELDGLARLRRGQIDGYIGALVSLSYHLRELGSADIKVVGRVIGDWTLSLATRNDEPELLSITQKMVDGLKDEDHQAIQRRWHSVQIEERLDRRLIWQWGGAVLMALVLLFLWNRKLGGLNRRLAEANRQLAQLTLTDALTGIGNRKYFDQEYPRSFCWCQRQGLGFAMAMIDIDHFKAINDRYGHAAGDDCLRSLATCLQGHLRRETDRFARLGGEEFVAFMPEDDHAALQARFESLRRGVEGLRIATDGKSIGFTISIGLASGVAALQDAPEAWLKRADDALYAAKRGGRNRVHGSE